MTEPKRLFDGGGGELERLLISAGRSARPSRLVRFRAGLTFTLAHARASARSALRPGERRWVAARWAVVGVTSTALAWGTAQQAHDYMVRRAASAESSEAPAAVAASPLLTPSVAELVARERAAPPPESSTLPSPPAAAPLPVTARNAAGRASANHARSIAREVDELDRVRVLLASGAAGEALERLDAYAKAFPSGVLQQEATLLRANALLATGQRERARSVAQRALTLYPHSAHAQRFRSLADMR